MNVLIVDDDPTLRELVRNFIEDTGLTVEFTEASHVAMALEILEDPRSSFSFIVSDYDMPGEKGFKLIEYWQERYNFIPFILFSSVAGQVNKEFNRKYGEKGKRIHFVNKDEGIEGFQNSLRELWRHGFSPMPLKYFKTEQELNADIYIRVNQTNILKVFNIGEEVDVERINSFRQRGLSNFYVNHIDFIKHKCMSCYFPLFKEKKGSLGISDALNEFELSFREVLERKVFKGGSLEKNFKQMSLDLSRLDEKKVFSFIYRMDFKKSNYVVNHSFLIILLSNLMLNELGLNKPKVRQSVLQAVIIHDIHLNNDDAWRRDLYHGYLDDEERKSIISGEVKLAEKVKTLEFDHDSMTIFNALKKGLFEDHFHVPGNHKVARVVVNMHKISNELYRNEFSRALEKDQLESIFKSDIELLKVSQNIFSI